VSSQAEAAQPHDPAPMIWAVATLCWTAATVLAVSGWHELHHDLAAGPAEVALPVRVAAYEGIWAVMVGAMMLPTTVPIARLVTAVTARLPAPGPVRSALYGSYLAVWSAFGLVALAGDVGVQAAIDRWAWLAGHRPLVLATTLALAGGFQFTSLKERCLTACRDPMTMLWQHYRRGVAGAWRLGTRHALSCLGCCWTLMLLLFGSGVASLGWMLALTAVMVAEKTTSWGARLSRPVGVVLLAASTVVTLAAFGLGPVAGLVTAHS
jgi:predicted metal-binding membrane protein